MQSMSNLYNTKEKFYIYDVATILLRTAMLKRILSQKLLANTSSHNYFLIRGAYSLTSIGSGDGEQSHEARVVMLKPVTQQLPRLSRSPPIYPDMLISLYMCGYVTMFGHYFLMQNAGVTDAHYMAQMQAKHRAIICAIYLIEKTFRYGVQD